MLGSARQSPAAEQNPFGMLNALTMWVVCIMLVRAMFGAWFRMMQLRGVALVQACVNAYLRLVVKLSY